MTGIELGIILRAARREQDLSQHELAELANVPVSTVARIESGAVTDPNVRSVERLLAAAGRCLVPLLAHDAANGADVNNNADQESQDPAAAPIPHESLRNRGGRRDPAHLDVFDSFPWFDRNGDSIRTCGESSCSG